MKRCNYIISGGGTGGHIYPAIAIAKALQLRDPLAKIVFVGALGKMEMEKVPKAGFPIHGLWISGLHRGQILRNLLFPLKLALSLLQSFVLWLRYRPKVVVGTGGFASGPMVFVSHLLGSKTLLQEQNSFAGITNKLLGKKATHIAVAYSAMDKYFPKHKVKLTGNPVRTELSSLTYTREEVHAFFDLDPNKHTLLVLGGSLGAATINQLVADKLSFFTENNVQLLWQCGTIYFEKYTSLSNDQVKIVPFIEAMDKAYAVADSIVSRAGAASISELSLIDKPAILIPSPNVAENHQYHNAMALVEKKAALMVEENMLSQEFESTFRSLLTSLDLRHELVANLKKFARPNATEDIVSLVIELKKDEA